jgi:hypothetical protein
MDFKGLTILKIGSSLLGINSFFRNIIELYLCRLGTVVKKSFHFFRQKFSSSGERLHLLPKETTNLLKIKILRIYQDPDI